MRLLPPDWSEAAEAARIAEEEPTNSEWDECDVAFFMICVLEQRELTNGDIYTELLSMEPLDYDVFCISGSPFYEENDGPGPPPCSTLGDCLLRRAASLGRVESAAMLLDLGARMDFAPSVLEYEGCLGTPLVNACVAGRLVIVRLLLERGAQVGAWTRCCNFYSVDEYFTIWMDWTALHAACAWGSLEVVQLLVDQGADPDLCCRYSRFEGYSDLRDEMDATEGPSAFHLACALGHVNIVAFLCETVGISIDTVGTMYGFSLCGTDRVWYIDEDPERTFADSMWALGDMETSLGYLYFPDSYGVRGMDRHSRASDFPCMPINGLSMHSRV